MRAPENELQYPAVMLLTADHDGRVVPLHSLKLIATLQSEISKLSHQSNPLLIKVDTKAGHGAGKPTAKVVSQTLSTKSFYHTFDEKNIVKQSLNF